MGVSNCTICRRQGAKLFLKGDRCFSPHCAMIERPYAPGARGKRRSRALSEYGKELREKQKLKNWYGLSEKQMKNYVKQTLAQRGKIENAPEFLIKKLESRLDNVIYRLGIASSRAQARQMVTHGHFTVNNKKVNIPSYLVKKGEEIGIKIPSQKKTMFQGLQVKLRKYPQPSWLVMDAEKLEAKVIGMPSVEESAPPVEISTIFEFYSR